jgi:hypothetical protein
VRWSDACAVVATLVAGAVYVGVVAAQGDAIRRVHVIVTATVLAAALTAALGMLARDSRLRLVLFGWTALTMIAWALLGSASVGPVFVPAAVLAFVAARRGAARNG